MTNEDFRFLEIGDRITPIGKNVDAGKKFIVIKKEYPFVTVFSDDGFTISKNFDTRDLYINKNLRKYRYRSIKKIED